MVMPLALLEKSMDHRISLLLKDTRVLEGKLVGYDDYMNMVLAMFFFFYVMYTFSVLLVTYKALAQRMVEFAPVALLYLPVHIVAVGVIAGPQVLR